MIKKLSRFGSYGVIRQNQSLLLAQKRSGPYKGKWGLPGGSIEFGETPEEALIREILEETAFQAVGLKFLQVITHNGNYKLDESDIQVHHIGILFDVGKVEKISGLFPEEKFEWFGTDGILEDQLTPFAKAAIIQLR